MYQRNLILIQIEHANKLIHSDWPQEKRLGFILLENLIEICIRKRVEQVIAKDGDRWDVKRKYTSVKRKKILSYHNDLLQCAFENGIINSETKSILNYVHSIRNESYHRFYQRNKDQLEIAILICCSFIRDDLAKWSNPGTGWSKDKGFENRYFSKSHLIGRGLEDEFNTLIPKLLDYGLDNSFNVKNLLENFIYNEILGIRRNLNELEKAIGNIDFNIILGAHLDISNIQIPNLGEYHPKYQLELILMFSSAACKLKEELLDLEDRFERYERFQKYLQDLIKSRPKYPYDFVKKFQKSDLQFSNKTLAQAIAKTISTLSHVSELGEASSDATNGLYDYLQYLEDQGR